MPPSLPLILEMSPRTVAKWAREVRIPAHPVYYVDGRRRAERIGTKAEYPTRAQLMRAAEPIRARCLAPGDSRLAPLSLAGVWEGYAKVKMPERAEVTDRVFASPYLQEKKPRSYICFYEKLGRVCQDAGIEHVPPHGFRHGYRAWLEELGTPISVQQRAMRHGDIRVTMNYGDP